MTTVADAIKYLDRTSRRTPDSARRAGRIGSARLGATGGENRENVCPIEEMGVQDVWW